MAKAEIATSLLQCFLREASFLPLATLIAQPAWTLQQGTYGSCMKQIFQLHTLCTSKLKQPFEVFPVAHNFSSFQLLMWSEKGCSLKVLWVTCHCLLLCLVTVWRHTQRKHHANRRTSVTAAAADVVYNSSHSRSSFPPSPATAPLGSIRSPLYPGAFERTAHFYFTHFPDLFISTTMC